MTTKLRTWLVMWALLAAPAWGGYEASPQVGVPYPALNSPSPLTLSAPQSVDPKERGRVTIPLGFEFPFYERSYRFLTITANGLLFLEPSTAANKWADFPANLPIPSPAEPNGIIAPLWDDLSAENAGSTLQTQVVSGPNGQGLAVEFKDWGRDYGTFSLTFQVRLWANGSIEFFYGAMSGVGALLGATIGIESPSGSSGTRGLLSCTNFCALSDFDPSLTRRPINSIRFGPQPGIDLQAISLRVDDVRQVGGELSITSAFTMRNFGTVSSEPFGYGLFLSQDAILDQNDWSLAPQPSGPWSLGPGVTQTHLHTSTVSSPDGGFWYVLAAIPPLPDGGEVDSDNNVAVSSVAYAGGVDLVAESVRPPPRANASALTSVEVALSNQGFEAAGAVEVKLLASVDASPSSDDAWLTSRTFTLGGGQQVAQALTFTWPGSIPAGDYFVLMELDDTADGGVVVERSELNNVVASSSQLTVLQPDLAVKAVRVLQISAPHNQVEYAFFGEPVRLEALVSNVGLAPAPEARVAFFLSDNDTLNALSDVLIGSVSHLSLAPGEERWVPLPAANVPTSSSGGQPLRAQPYFFFAAVSADNQREQDTGNNIEKSRPTVARAPAPNLVADAMVTPSLAGAGELVAVSRTLRNLGNRDAIGAKYRFFLSANPLITAEDIPLMRVTSGGDVLDGIVNLAVGQSDSMVEILRMPEALASTQYIGVLVDPDGTMAEVEEFDNGLAGGRTEVASTPIGLDELPLPDAIMGVAYLFQLSGHGAPGPFSFRLATPSSLPPGLTLSSAGVVSGRPTQVGVFSCFVEIETNGRTTVAVRPIRVLSHSSSLQITTAALPALRHSVPYRAGLTAAGGAGGYRFELASGMLPLGLLLGADGELSGTPTESVGASHLFVVRVTDSLGTSGERAYSMTVVDPALFTIETTELPDGQLWMPYRQSIRVRGSGVLGPLSWQLVGGELPPGLGLNLAAPGGETVELSGRPTRPGRYRFTIEAADGQGRIAAFTYLISVSVPSVSASGAGSKLVDTGGEVSVVFSASPLPEGTRWFWRGGRLPPGVIFSEDGTVRGTVLAEARPETYSFTVGVGLEREQLFSLASWSLEVAPPKKRAGSGCSTSAEGSLWVAAALVWVASRRRALRPPLRNVSPP